MLELSAQCLAFDQGILGIYSSNYSMKAVAKIPQSAIPQSAIPQSAIPHSAIPHSAIPQSAIHLEIQYILLSIFF